MDWRSVATQVRVQGYILIYYMNCHNLLCFVNWSLVVSGQFLS